MKATVRAGLVLCVVCLGMSGSSIVEIKGSHYLLRIESYRMTFADGEGGEEYHKAWVKENKPLVEAMKPTMEKFIEELRKGDKQLPDVLVQWGPKLTPYEERSPLLNPALKHAYDYTVALRNGAPYRVQVQGLLGVDGDTYLLVCFSEPVDVGVLDAIKSSLKPRLATAAASYRVGRHSQY